MKDKKIKQDIKVGTVLLWLLIWYFVEFHNICEESKGIY
jgi:hypothetical protein